MNYQIIKHEEKLLEFINWLPDLIDGETYYITLFSRKKYYALLKSDKTQLKRFTSDKKRLFQKIKQLECKIGSYIQGDIIIPNEALAVYISPNPRSNLVAAKNSLKLLADLITGDKKDYNLHQEIMSQVQQSKGRSFFQDFDFDNVYYNEKIESEVLEIINRESYHILNTRGGFHLLVESKKVISDKKNWYLGLKKIHQKYSSDTDGKGDNLIPIPGTNQGMYVVNMNYGNNPLNMCEL